MYFLALLFTVFIDSLGFGLVFPVFTPMIVNNEGAMFSPEVSLMQRGLIFGLLVSSYCIGQFFGGPFLGAMSDRIGRKKILISAMILAFWGYFVAILGVVYASLWILFFARFVAGISAGSFPVAQSVMADLSENSEKAKNFGMVGMSCWLGFVIGPFLGGKLAPYGFSIPFVVAAIFCFANALLLFFSLKEIPIQKKEEGKMVWFRGITQLVKAFTIPGLKYVFIVMFIFCLGWGFFTEFTSIFLMLRLEFNVGQIANFFAWVGLWIAICQGILIRPILKKFSPKQLLTYGLLLLGLALPGMFFVKGMIGLLFLVPGIAFAQAMVFPNAATLVSNSSSKEAQGEMLGVNNSVQWAAIAIPPLFSGGFVAKYPHLPVTVGSICMLVAFLIFLKTSRKLEMNLEE